MNSPERRAERAEATRAHESRPLVRLGATPLDDIAALILSLTYGEMLELAKGLAQGGEITETTLPAVLWKWSMRCVR